MKKRKDGRYRKEFRFKGKRYYAYGTTSEEMELNYIDLRNKLRNGYGLKGNTKIGGLASEWFDVYVKKDKEKSLSSKETYASIVNTHIYKFKDIALEDFTPFDLDKYLANLDRSNSLKHKIRLTFKQIFDLAVANKMILHNPIDDTKKIRKSETTNVALTAEQRKLVLEILEDTDGYLFVFTLMNTGLRGGEAFALTWSDFDTVEHTLKINKALDMHSFDWSTKDPKTAAGNRVIPVPDDLYDLLIEEKKKSSSLYIFHKYNNMPHARTSAENFWTRSVKNVVSNHFDCMDMKEAERCKNENTEFVPCERIKINFRTFRHTYATALYDAGVDVKEAQELMGHADFQTTMNIYTHIREERRASTKTKIFNLYDSVSKDAQKSKLKISKFKLKIC